MVNLEASGAWVATESILDTGFQILKAAAFMELWDGNSGEAKLTAELMSDWAPSWLISMENADKRGKYAWSHTEKEGVKTFRLDEHVWIWRALKSLDMKSGRAWDVMAGNHRESDKSRRTTKDVLVQSHNISPADERVVSGRSPFPPSKCKVRHLRITFAPEVVQREVSRRFTTKNHISGKRMLAVTRSLRKSRFALRACDTTIFYKEMFDFLGESTSTKALWNNTIDSQLYNDGNEKAGWRNPLHYALCIMLGTRELRINHKTPKELIRTATDILFGSSGPNGRFPGSLRPSTTDPVEETSVAEEDLDDYYRASFEIPYILLTHANEVIDAYDPHAPHTTGAFKPNPNIEGDLADNGYIQKSESIGRSLQTQLDASSLPEDANQLQLLLHHLSKLVLEQLTNDHLDNSEFLDSMRRPKTGQKLTSEKAVPSITLADYDNIVEIEEEWLFCYPEFFLRDTDLDSADFDKASADLQEVGKLSTTVDKGPRQTTKFVIVDIPHLKPVERRRHDYKPRFRTGFRPDKLRRLLAPVRTAQSSEKRILHFSVVTKEAISICYAATEVTERYNMLDFFERHSRYEKYVNDECSMAHNTWKTEMHLSYYQLSESSSGSPTHILTLESGPFPGVEGKHLVRASAGFRFNGDFFNRSWTCYVLEQAQIPTDM